MRHKCGPIHVRAIDYSAVITSSLLSCRLQVIMSQNVPSTPPRPPEKDRVAASALSPATPTGRTQALKDLKLTIEYKHLKTNAPGGVLVTPAFDDLRLWHGVIFVRKGFWQGGVFKFTVRLPKAYNDHGVFPEVRLQAPGQLGNPFVAPATGLLDLRHAFPAWEPTTHFMVTVLTFLKKVFYLKDEDLEGYASPADPAAARLFLENKVCARDKETERQRECKRLE